MSSPDSHAAPYNANQLNPTDFNRPANAQAKNGFRMKRTPEVVYTSSSFDPDSPQSQKIKAPRSRPMSRCSSIVSLASNVSVYEDHFNDLRLAAKLGKILLQRNRKLECELELARREVAARDKEIGFLRDKSIRDKQFYEEQVESIGGIQSSLKQAKLDLVEKTTELERTKAHLNFQKQQTQDLEEKLQKELQWRAYYTSETASPPSIASIHQKMRRNMSESEESVGRHVSAEAAYSQSRMDAEIEEIQMQHMEDIALKNYEIQQLEIILDEHRQLLAQTELNQEQLEYEKQSLNQQIQELSAMQTMSSVNLNTEPRENELESIDAKNKRQQAFEMLTGKFDRILDSIETEKQRVGTFSETASQHGFSRSGSIRVKLADASSIAEPTPMLSRYLSAQVKKEGHINPYDYGKRKPKHVLESEQVLADNSPFAEYAFDRDYSTLTVKAAEDEENAENEPSDETLGSNSDEILVPPQNQEPVTLQYQEHRSVSQCSDSDEDDEFHSINIGAGGMSEDFSQEEPEYKRLFQELFDLIHTVIPDGEQ